MQTQPGVQALINSDITTNGLNQITGALLNSVLTVMNGAIFQSSTLSLTNGESSSSAIPGSAVYLYSGGNFKLAKANGISTAGIIGLSASTIVSGASGVVTIGSVITLTTAQWDAIVTGQSGGLTAGILYFLDPSTFGFLTATPPSTAGQVITLIGRALSTTQLLLTIGSPALL